MALSYASGSHAQSGAAQSGALGDDTSLGHVVMLDAYDEDGPLTMSDRLPYELLFGGLSTGAGLLGHALSLQRVGSCYDTADSLCTTTTSDADMAATALVGAGAIMTPLAIYMAGEANGGDGNFWSTLGYGGLGALTSGLLSTPLAAAFYENDRTMEAILVSTMWIGYFAGSLIGYELSSGKGYDSVPEDEKSSQTRSQVLLAPSVATTPDQRGASIGLIGAF